ADLARPYGVQAEDRAEQLGPTRADQARDPHDLAPTDSQRRLAGQTPARQIAEFKEGYSRNVGNTGKQLRQVAADHLGDDRRQVDAVKRCRGDRPAVSKNRITLSDATYFFQEMADVNDRDPLRTEAGDDLEEPLGVVLGQRAGGFIENNHARIGDQ